jgi:hypothetical protein
MAVFSLCSSLKNGQDASCTNLVTRYYQQAVIINKDDIDQSSVIIDTPVLESAECAYNVQFSLKEGKTGFRFAGPETGSSYKGLTAKIINDLGFVKQKHSVQVLIVGANENTKCILDSLGRGRFVVAIQFTDGTIEIYGIQNGLTAEDYTYDVQDGGGGSAIILSSPETSPENYLPLVYKSLVSGSETADFDSNFENIVVP